MDDLTRFDTLTFDCYGTLIDWEAGILAALRPVLAAHGVRAAAGDDDLLASHARHESRLEAGEYRPYREILRGVLEGIGADHGFTPTEAERDAFAASVGDWPAFPDTVDALRRLKARFRLVVLSNVDDDLFARTAERLGTAFDAVITAQQVGAYKPAHAHFLRAEAQLGLRKDRWLHVAQSRYHDIVPANTLGIASCLVDRRHRATPGADAARPDLVVPDLKTLAELASSEP